MDINRVGQKVVCIVSAGGWRAACFSLKQFPVQGAVYTVAGFADSLGHPGIHLAGQPGYSCACKRIAATSWPLSAFKPVDERETDISALRDLLLTTPATPKRVDA